MNSKWTILTTICLLAVVVFLTSASVWSVTIEVSQPTYMTSNQRYDRNPSIINDGTNYWLFYTKGDQAAPAIRDSLGYNPDADKYVVYYKTASTIAGLAGATETKLGLSESARPTGFTQRVVSATYFNSKVYAFVSSGQDGTDQGLYYYKYSGGSWTGPTTLIAHATARGGHVNVTSDANRVYIVWESSDGSSDCYTWDGTTLSSKIDISTDNMPKINLMGTALYVVSIEDGTGDIEVHSGTAGPSPSFPWQSTAIAGADLYDPCIFNDGTNLYVVSAPYVSANDQQYLIQAKYSGGAWATTKRVTYGGYGTTYWWEYWPIGYYDGTNLYVFYTTESSSPVYGDGEIACLRMNWNLGNDHYCDIQTAIDQAISGDVINVAAGTYYESDVTITKSLSLTGSGEANTFLAPAVASGHDYAHNPPGSHHGILIQSNNVTIQDLTIDGNLNASLVPPTLNYHNGLWQPATTNQLTVKSVTIKNVWWRGINLRYGGTGHLVDHVTIQNVSGYTAGEDGRDQNIGILFWAPSSCEVRYSTVTSAGVGIATGSSGSMNVINWHHNQVTNVDVFAYETVHIDVGSVFTNNTASNASPGEATGYYSYYSKLNLQNNTFTGFKYGAHMENQNTSITDLVIGSGTTFAGPGSGVAGSVGILGQDVDYPGFGINFTVDGASITAYETGLKTEHSSGDTSNIAVKNSFLTGHNIGIEVGQNGIVSATKNDLSSNATKAFDNTTLTVMDASVNWWGSNTAGGVAAKASANVDYTPWLHNGTDLGDPGFQPDLSYLHVDDNSPQTGTIKRIKEGINLVTGSTVKVEAGTYAENIVINKSLSLLGAGQASVLVYTDSSNVGTPGASFQGSQMVVVEAPDVWIDGFTFDGDNPGLPGTPDARNGIICNYNVATPNNLKVTNCTVKNLYLRGIYATGAGAVSGVNIKHNTVDNVKGVEGNSAAIMFYNTTGNVDTNTVTNSHLGAFFQYLSDGNIRYNHFTNCDLGCGVNSNDALTTISHNTIAYPGDWGAIQVVNQQAAVNIQNNTITNASWGPIVFGGSSGNVSNFQNNSIYGPMVKGDLPKKATLVNFVKPELWANSREGTLAIHPPSGAKYGDVGIYLTTDMSPWGYADVNATFSGNIVANYDYDVICNEPAGNQTKLMNVTFGGSPGTTNYLYGYGTYAWQMDNCNDNIDAQYNYWATTTPEDVIYDSNDVSALGNVNSGNYQIPKVSLTPISQLDKCTDKDTLWIYLDEHVVDMEAYYCSLSYNNSYITPNTVINGPDLPASSFKSYYFTTDRIIINVGILSGNFDGPGKILGIVLTTNSQTVPDSTGVKFLASIMRDPNNQSIPHTTSDAYIKIDCTSPTVRVISPDSGRYYNYFPTLQIRFTDNINLNRGYYQIDNCPGTWTELWSYNSNSNDTTISWQVPSVNEGYHKVYFKVTDDEGNHNVDTCDYFWSFHYDTTPPPPPTDFVARPGHQKCKLSWTNPTGDPSFHKVMIRRNPWAVGAYPEYDDDFPTPLGFPGSHTQGTFVCTTSAESYKDTNNTTLFPRNVYYYSAFSYDLAGNYSAAATSGQDRATNYWLGDVAGPGGLNNYDGQVYYEDLTYFSVTFGKSHGQPGYQNQFDIGPTYNHSPTGIPTTDNIIDFEDLSIFSINFDAVNPNMKIAPIFADQEIAGQLGLSLLIPISDYLQVGEEFKVSVLLRNNPDLVKSIHFVLPYNASQLEFVRVEKSKLLKGTTWPVFFNGRDIDHNIDVNLSLLGGEATIGGSGEIAIITFKFLQSGNLSLAFSLVDFRDNQNHNLFADEDIWEQQLSSELPSVYGLSQNYPNTFNPTTQIAYQLPQAGHVSLKIYNIKGELVCTLVNEYKEAGYHNVIWDGKNENGEEVASGVYFYRMVSNDFKATKKMIMLK